MKRAELQLSATLPYPGQFPMLPSKNLSTIINVLISTERTRSLVHHGHFPLYAYSVPASIVATVVL